MAEQTVVHIGENSPEQVAFKLWQEIVQVEVYNANKKPDRKWILDTYAECLTTVHAPTRRLSSAR